MPLLGSSRTLFAKALGREEDSSDDEEELMAHPWPRQDLRDKANASVAKRRRHRRTEGTQGLSTASF